MAEEVLRGWEVEGCSQEDLDTLVPETIPQIRKNQLLAIGVDSKKLNHPTVTSTLQKFALQEIKNDLGRQHTLAVDDDGIVHFVASNALTQQLLSKLPTTEVLSAEQAQAIVNAAAAKGPFYELVHINADMINQSLKQVGFQGFVEDQKGQNGQVWQLTATPSVREKLTKYADSLQISHKVMHALGSTDQKDNSARQAIELFCKTNQLTLPADFKLRFIPPDGDVCIITEAKILPQINEKLPKVAKIITPAQIAALVLTVAKQSVEDEDDQIELKTVIGIQTVQQLVGILKKLGIQAGVELNGKTFSLYATDGAWKEITAAYAPFAIN